MKFSNFVSHNTMYFPVLRVTQISERYLDPPHRTLAKGQDSVNGQSFTKRGKINLPWYDNNFETQVSGLKDSLRTMARVSASYASQLELPAHHSSPPRFSLLKLLSCSLRDAVCRAVTFCQSLCKEWTRRRERCSYINLFERQWEKTG